MNYGKYKNARNAAWQCTIDYGICKLPVIVTEIINASNDINLYRNSDLKLLKDSESGMTVVENKCYNIVYNDTENSRRCRFTIAHELGHIFLGHLLINTSACRTFAIRDDNESAANVFARDLLAPACVLHELGVTTADDISILCDISIEAATYRAERMAILEKRKAWYRHPLEKQVRRQFEDFIKSKMAE